MRIRLRVLRSLISLVRLTIWPLLFALVRWWAPKTRFGRLELVASHTGKEYQRHFSQIIEALQSIAENDPNRFRRIERDLRWIVIASHGGPMYSPHLNACIFNVAYVEQSTPAQLALAIVHEATHARIRQAGIRPDAAMRGRIEQICVSNEVAFAGKLPGAESLAREAAEKLTEPWWTEQKRFQRVQRELRSLGYPNWVLRLRRRLFEPDKES
jgi:hypothetical protein